MMLPLPRAAILGGERGHEEVGGTDVGVEEPVVGRDVEVGGRSEPGDPGIVDQHVDGIELCDETVDLGWVAQVGGDESGPTPFGLDGVDDLGAPLRVPTVHHDRVPVAAEPERRRPADARGGAGDQRDRRHSFCLNRHGGSSLCRRIYRPIYLSTTGQRGSRVACRMAPFN